MNCFDKVTFENNITPDTGSKKEDDDFLIIVGKGIPIGCDVKTNEAFVKNMRKLREEFKKRLQNK